jgi:D-galactarolactone cycloisomerase
MGKDPLDISKFWIGEPEKFSRMPPSTYFGVDMALWDLIAKKMNVPLYRVLGGQLMEKIKVYASSLYFKRKGELSEFMAKEALKCVDQGFDSIKIKIGYSPERDIQCVKAVRDVVGENIQLTVDAQKAYNSHTAIKLGRELEKHGVYWFEEPVPQYDLKGYLEVRDALDMAVAGGESLTTLPEFAEFLSIRAIDIIQPDMCAGGINGCRKIATIAEAFNVMYVPHCWATQITVAAWLHLLSSLPPFPSKVNPFPPLLEYDISTNPIRDEIIMNPLHMKASYIKVPNKPGMGVELDEKALKKYSKNFKVLTKKRIRS